MTQPKTVAVVGLGYVGLPLALLARTKGWSVIGIDTDADKVADVSNGVSPLADDAVVSALKADPLNATTDPAQVSNASVVVIAVPTPVTDDNAPDLRPLTGALESLAPHLSSGQVLVVESTINPGVMDEVVVPLLREHNLPLEIDGAEHPVRLAHCPERINPGDPNWHVGNIPRVIGGYTLEGTEAAAHFYDDILEAPVKRLGSVTEAEAVKILENTFRDVNIAFINEMARSFDALGIDIMSVIEGAATKPFAFMPHYPGNGVGGHCISVDPYYMIERAKQVGFDHEFLKLAREINNSMPAYSVQLLEAAAQEAGISSDAPVALLGLSYKKNVADLRESPALDVRALLEASDHPLHVFDPLVPDQSTVSSLDEALEQSDVVMLATAHDALVEHLTPENLKALQIKLVVDGRNALDADGIAQADIIYRGIGRKR